MAFSASEKAFMLFYLGYSGFEDDGPAMRAINSLDAKETTMGPIVRDLLTKLDQVRNDVHQARVLGKAVQTGGVQLRGHYTVDHLWRIGRSYVSQLARWTKIMVAGDVFSTGGSERNASFYSGDPSENRVDSQHGVPMLGE